MLAYWHASPKWHASPERAFPDATLEELRAYWERRRQVVGMITQEKNRLGEPHLPTAIRTAIEKHIVFLDEAWSSFRQPSKTALIHG